MLNCQFSILVCFYSVAKWKEHSVTKVNGNPPQSEVNFLKNYFFSQQPNRGNWTKKQTKNKKPTPSPKKMYTEQENLPESADFFLTMILVSLESTATETMSFFNVDIMVQLTLLWQATTFGLLWLICKVASCRLIIEATFDSSNDQKPVSPYEFSLH